MCRQVFAGEIENYIYLKTTSFQEICEKTHIEKYTAALVSWRDVPPNFRGRSTVPYPGTQIEQALVPNCAVPAITCQKSRVMCHKRRDICQKRRVIRQKRRITCQWASFPSCAVPAITCQKRHMSKETCYVLHVNRDMSEVNKRTITCQKRRDRWQKRHFISQKRCITCQCATFPKYLVAAITCQKRRVICQ